MVVKNRVASLFFRMVVMVEGNRLPLFLQLTLPLLFDSQCSPNLGKLYSIYIATYFIELSSGL